MLSKRVAVAVAVVLAIIFLAEAKEEGPHDMAETIRMLQELDRLYTQAARPRIDRRDVADAGSMDQHSLDRAVRLVQLWKLDNMYSYKTRPRNRREVKRYWTLEELHDMYYSRTRPRFGREVADRMDRSHIKKVPNRIRLRFGKRSDTYANWAKDVEKPDLPAWLSYARRR